jgi:hypothetical protein
MSVKKSNETIGNRSRDLPFCSGRVCFCSDIFTVSWIKLKVCLFLFQRDSAMAGVRGNDDSDNNFSDDDSTPLYGGRSVFFLQAAGPGSHLQITSQLCHFAVLTVVNTNISILWGVTCCSLLQNYAFNYHLHPRRRKQNIHPKRSSCLTNYTEWHTVARPFSLAISITFFYQFITAHYPRFMFCLHCTKSSTSLCFSVQDTPQGWSRHVARTVKKIIKTQFLLKRGEDARLLGTGIQADNIKINIEYGVVKLWPGFDWFQSRTLTSGL